MNAKTLAAVIIASFAFTMQAQQRPKAIDAATTTTKKPLDWNDPKWWEANRTNAAHITVGKSEFMVTGPLIETFRVARPSPDERSLGRKFLDLPIINLFVPGPMPPVGNPGVERKYFAWGDRGVPWTVLADRPIPGPQSSLISVTR